MPKADVSLSVIDAPFEVKADISPFRSNHVPKRPLWSGSRHRNQFMGFDCFPLIGGIRLDSIVGLLITLDTHASVFNLGRHNVRAKHYRDLRISAFTE